MKHSILAILLAAVFLFAQETVEPQNEPQIPAPAEASQEVAAPQVAAPQVAEPQVPAAQAAPVAAPEPVETPAQTVYVVVEQPAEPKKVETGIENKPTKQDWLLYTGIAASAWSLISLCSFGAFDEDAKELYEDADTQMMSRDTYEQTRAKIKHKQKWRNIWGMHAAISAGVVALTWIPWIVINF